MKNALRALSVVLIAALAACSGGNGSLTPSAPGGGTGNYKSAKVQMSILIPKQYQKHGHGIGPMIFRANDGRVMRHPNFVSVSTASIVFTLSKVNGGAPPTGFNSTVVVNTTSGQDCGQDTGATGALVCHATTSAPVATDTFTVTAYQGAGGTGNILGSNVIAQAIAAGSNTIDITLAPVVASTSGLAWSTASVNVGNGTAAGNSVTLNAKDPAGNIIIAVATGCATNCTTFNTPIYLKADGSTPDYIGWTCNNAAINVFSDGSSHSVQAHGQGASLTDGTSLSTPVASLSSGTVSAPNGATVTQIGNNANELFYNGTAQASGVSTID